MKFSSDALRPIQAPLRQRISAQLSRIIRSYVIAITLLLAVFTLLFGYYFKLNQLAHHRDLVSTNMDLVSGTYAEGSDGDGFDILINVEQYGFVDGVRPGCRLPPGAHAGDPEDA